MLFLIEKEGQGA